MPNTDCILWPGPKTVGGYGRIGKIYAHRFIWSLYNGHIPPGLEVCHHCDVPSCVNPRHLFAGSHDDNMRDMRSKGRGYHTNYHTGEYNKGSKLTDNDVREIRLRVRMKAPGRRSNIPELAKEYGLTYGNIKAVVLRKTWRHI